MTSPGAEPTCSSSLTPSRSGLAGASYMEAFPSLRHDEQPTRVIDEERLGIVRSIGVSEVVRVVRHRQTVGPRVLEEETRTESRPRLLSPISAT